MEALPTDRILKLRMFDAWKELQMSKPILPNINRAIDYFKLKARGFIPLHTQLFIDKIKEDSKERVVMARMIEDEVTPFQRILRQENLSYDALKEVQLLSAFFDAKNSFNLLINDYGTKVDSNTLNMALLSGKYTGEKLQVLTKFVKPTYDSIRYGIRSGNFELLKELVETYGLKLTSDHFISVAAVGNMNMFDFLVAQGLKPEGNLVLQTATYAAEKIYKPELNESPEGSQAIVEALVDEYGYTLPDESSPAAALRNH